VLLGTVIFIGVFGYSYFRFKNKTPQDFFETGKKFYDQGKYSEATNQLLNANRSTPDNRDIRYYLALSYLGQGDLANGMRHLKALLEVHPDDVPANLKLGGIYLTGGSVNSAFFQQAQASADLVLAKEPQNVDALILAGNATAGLKDFETSVKLLEKAVAADPKSVSAWISLGSLRAQQKNFPEAEKAFLKAREVDPKNKSALISLANFYSISGNPEKAVAVFNSAFAQSPSDKEIYSQAADFYIRLRRFDEAEKILRSAQAANESDPTPTLALAEVYRFQNRGDDTRKLLLDAKLKFPKSIPLSIMIASNLMPDKRDQAKQEIDQILKADPKNPAGHALLGEFQFRSGQFDTAQETLGKEPALGSSLPQVHYLLGILALKKGKRLEAEDHYQKSIRINDRYIPPRVTLADSFMSRGKFADARLEMQKVLELDPRNMPARLIKATLDAADKNYSAAEAGFADLAREYPDNPDIHRQIGLYYSSRGRNADAEKSFLREMDLAPNAEQSLLDLVQFYLQTKQTDRAMQKLNSVPDAQKQAFHYEWIGMTDELAGKPQDAEMAYKKALEKDPQRMTAESQLFTLYLRTGRLDDALKTLDALAKNSPSNAMVPAMKAQIEAIKGNSKQAEEDYRKALQIDPTLDVAANNLAYLLAEEGRDLQTALELARGVRQRQPQNPSVADTLGWVYFKLDLPVLARAQALFAVSIQPQNGSFQYHLGEIYKKSSQKDEAIKAFRKAVSVTPEFKEKSLAEAELKDLLKGQTSSKQ
jgi:tetratricopeptide (TPR) repeat protein